jgi:hypothetical protein
MTTLRRRSRVTCQAPSFPGEERCRAAAAELPGVAPILLAAVAASSPDAERSGAVPVAAPDVASALAPCAALAVSLLDAERFHAVPVAAPDVASVLAPPAVHAASLLDAGRFHAVPAGLLRARLVWIPCAAECSWT